MLRQYRALKKRLSDTPDWDDRFEIYQEELNTFLKQMPEGMLKAEEERQQINAILQEIRHEKRIVNRIVEEERSLNKEQKISKTERTEIRAQEVKINGARGGKKYHHRISKKGFAGSKLYG